jgi:hypothetical protein
LDFTLAIKAVMLHIDTRFDVLMSTSPGCQMELVLKFSFKGGRENAYLSLNITKAIGFDQNAHVISIMDSQKVEGGYLKIDSPAGLGINLPHCFYTSNVCTINLRLIVWVRLFG